MVIQYVPIQSSPVGYHIKLPLQMQQSKSHMEAPVPRRIYKFRCPLPIPLSSPPSLPLPLPLPIHPHTDRNLTRPPPSRQPVLQHFILHQPPNISTVKVREHILPLRPRRAPAPLPRRNQSLLVRVRFQFAHAGRSPGPARRPAGWPGPTPSVPVAVLPPLADPGAAAAAEAADEENCC